MSEQKNKIRAWLEAFRLRTLPLAAATVLIGAVPSIHLGVFRLDVFLMVLLTTFCLQILSNLANDYGDYSKGTDNEARLGPVRTVQGGLIAPKAMKNAIILFVSLSLLSGVALLSLALGSERLLSAIVMLLLGGLAIWAAVNYTVGKNAFGYKGFGDLFVFLFFGLVGVCGTSFLIVGELSASVFVLALSPGLFAVGVLNVNNMRDILNDKRSGKQTLVVKLGIRRSRLYHTALISVGFLAGGLYILMNDLAWQHLLIFVTLPLFIKHLNAIHHLEGKLLDSQLKALSLSSLIYSLLLFILLFVLV